MERTFDEVALAADFDALSGATHLDAVDRWSASQMGRREVHVRLSPIGHAEEFFYARLVWEKYPDAAPSVLFFDHETGRTDVARAWPTGGPFRPMTGLCVNYTREGFALHPEWVSDPRLRWRSDGNVLLKVIRLLQDDLDAYYSGRHG
ncbi:MAG: hypothetical protein ACT4O1_15510 [Gemmatimonadota bacterium]